eukprot:Selendium_serpulae@DN6304_c1_g2_i1.p1
MSKLYWERQQGRFCALHCLNALLQAPVFDQRQLEKIGWELDRQERSLLAGKQQRVMDSAALSESEHTAGDGYHSIGVIQKCLQSKNLECLTFHRESAQQLIQEQGFICHHQDHWFAIRKVNGQWWNLDSLKNGPSKISASDLIRTLTLLKQNGYSVLIVTGDYTRLPKPPSSLAPHQYYITESEIPKIEKETEARKKDGGGDGDSSSGDTSSGANFTVINPREKKPDVYYGEGQSLRDKKPGMEGADDPELQAALMASMESAAKSLTNPAPEPDAAHPGAIRTRLRMGPHGDIMRCFFPETTMATFFLWIEYEASKKPIIPMLQTREYYCIGQMPLR